MDMGDRRFITAESEAGEVVVKIESLADKEREHGVTLTNLWGYDTVPTLPVRPEMLANEHVRKGLFGPLGGLRVSRITFDPSGAEASDQDGVGLDHGFGGGLIESGDGAMHRTDTVDLIIVLEGSISVEHPRGDGTDEEITLSAGDTPLFRMGPTIIGTTVRTRVALSWQSSFR